MKFRHKIRLLPAIAACLLIAGGVASYMVAASTAAALRALQYEAYPFKEGLDRFAASAEAFRTMVQAAASEGDATKLVEARAMAHAAEEELTRLAAFAPFAGDVQGMRGALGDYIPAALSAAQAMVGNGEMGDAMHRMQTGKAKLDALLDQGKQRAARAVAAQQQAAGKGVDRILLVQLAAGLLTLLILGAASAVLTRSLWNDMGDEPDTLRKLTERIAQGDLASALNHDGSDAVGLRAALQRMTRQLHAMVMEIRETAVSIAGASGEIALGNHDLSARTERSAADLQQTSYAMEQMTSSVRQTAESAQQACQLAGSATSSAQRGGAIVERVVAQMDAISADSRRISEIIGVIDGIAFQTNILALNAAVEAARAGEQGRGFAVVAAEVRLLAQRCAQAAREIKELLSVSSDKIADGALMVRDAGAAMGGIVESVRRVADIIESMRAVSTEQSQGIANVNQAVLKLDAMTQQNAALVEESASAASTMTDQANSLRQAVSAFRVQQGDAPELDPASEVETGGLVQRLPLA